MNAGLSEFEGDTGFMAMKLQQLRIVGREGGGILKVVERIRFIPGHRVAIVSDERADSV